MTAGRESLLAEFAWRGLLHQTAGAEIEAHLATPGRVGYAGFDPTADSLTVGNLVPMILLRHWQLAGHRPIVLMGGGTGLIGDPSGKDSERQLQSEEQVAANVASQQRIFARVLDFSAPPSVRPLVLNNADWLVRLGYIEMLRTVGKYFSVNVMMQKDSVRTRLESRDQGISYTEFSYQILQAYDFLHLRRAHGCTVQMSGSDQFGNIIAGMDLIRRELGSEAGESYAITAPLVTRSDGKKFGKSEAGAVWLSAERTSPYAFYQFWLNVDDVDAIAHLKRFTFLPRAEIEALVAAQQAAPHERAAQRVLARQLVEMLHGPSEFARVELASQALFGKGDVRSLDAELLKEVFAGVPSSVHEARLLSGEGVALLDVLTQTTLAPSKRQAREFLANGAVFVNGQKAAADAVLKTTDLLHGKTILLRRGKKDWHATEWR
ncbi:MAG: tyrosine--tRNA ligase [Planctomycetota bacterium]